MIQVDPHIIEFLATYATLAGQSAAQAAGTSAIHALGAGAKTLYEKVLHKFKTKGGAAEATIQEFEKTPGDQTYQKMVLALLEKFSQEDPTFAQELMQLFSQVKQTPQYIQLTLQIIGDNHGMAVGQNTGSIVFNLNNYAPQIQRRVGVLQPPIEYQLGSLNNILSMLEHDSHTSITLDQLDALLARGAWNRGILAINPAYEPLSLQTAAPGVQELIEQGRLRPVGANVLAIVKQGE